MRECISICVGQAGVQMGNSFWELFCIEHGISLDGKYPGDKNQISNQVCTFFQECRDQYVPRSVFVDLDQTVIDQVRKGPMKKLFKPRSLFCPKNTGDAANNFSRGYYTIGKSVIDDVMDELRKQAETCSGIQGLFLFHSLCGGTGSGLGSLILEKLHEEFGKKTKITFSIFPSEQFSTSVVEPYNFVFGANHLNQFADFSLVFDNQAMYKYLSNSVKIENPNYTNINRLIAQVYSSSTVTLRFDGSMNIDIADMYITLVTNPSIHYMVSSYGPLLLADKTYQNNTTVQSITEGLLDSQNFFTKCNTKKGKYMGGCLIYRGDIQPWDVNQSLENIKKENKVTLEFADWCPQVFKIGLNNTSSMVFPGGELAKTQKSSCFIANHSSISNAFKKSLRNFTKLFQKKSFVNWFSGEGMEIGEFQENEEDLQKLLNEYSTCLQDPLSSGNQKGGGGGDGGKQQALGQKQKDSSKPKDPNKKPDPKQNQPKQDDNQLNQAKPKQQQQQQQQQQSGPQIQGAKRQ